MHKCVDEKGNKYAEEYIDDKFGLWFMPFNPEPGYTQLNFCPMCGLSCITKVPYTSYEF